MAERKRGSPPGWRFLVSLSLAPAAAPVAPAADSAPTQGQLTTLDVTRTGWQLNVATNFAAGPSFVVPTSADQCKDRGWGELTDDTGTPFKNQGDCVSFVATGGKNPAA